MKTIRNIVVAVAVVFVLGLSTGICKATSTARRRITVGTETPEFSAVDTTGKPFAYTRSSGKVLILVFLSSEQQRSQDAKEDILSVLSSIPQDKYAALQVVFVMPNVDNSEYIASILKQAPTPVRILADNQYHIWGKFGVIATPTVLISDAQGKVLCVKPGLAYDVAPVVRFRLFQALELPNSVSPEEASVVRTVTNSTLSAKAKRHLRTARLLLEKGRLGPAVVQAQMAYQIDPNSEEVALELAELLYKAGWAGQAPKAIELVSGVSPQGNRDKARINLILGWANRELGKLDEAEAFVNKGIKQNPKSPRLLFELGRIHQKRKDTERAMQAYYRALKLIYPEERT